MKNTVIPCLLLLATYAATAQTIVPFSSNRWVFSGPESELVIHKGEEALKMQGGQAWLEDVKLVTGTVEFDVSFTDTRGFQGVRFRVQDRSNYEEFYLRSHLSEQPDANQYNPVINNNSSWQLYHGEGYSAPSRYSDDWMRVRLVLEEETGEVFIDGKWQFSFTMKGNMGAGGLGLYASQTNTAFFSNFNYEESSPKISKPPATFSENEPGTVLVWEVSEQVVDAAILKGNQLSTEGLDVFIWQKLWAEEKGITNLARATSSNGRGALLARVDFDASVERVLPVQFGYSDRVDVYLNGQLLYRGNNSYVSRDYRYLGTIGQFDELSLSVNKGKNSLVFVVTEAFGGWGVTATFPETSGVSFGEGVVQE